jgi:hypothetical protein
MKCIIIHCFQQKVTQHMTARWTWHGTFSTNLYMTWQSPVWQLSNTYLVIPNTASLATLHAELSWTIIYFCTFWNNKSSFFSKMLEHYHPILQVQNQNFSAEIPWLHKLICHIIQANVTPSTPLCEALLSCSWNVYLQYNGNNCEKFASCCELLPIIYLFPVSEYPTISLVLRNPGCSLQDM